MGAVATPPTAHTWLCPSCGRRVPLRAAACHCGMTRARAEELQAAEPQAAAAPPRARRATSEGREVLDAMTTDVKLLLALGAFTLLLGLGWLAFGPRPSQPPPVLGWVDSGPPKPPPTAPRKPPFKLPWWK